jgi:hypothetical protein
VNRRACSLRTSESNRAKSKGFCLSPSVRSALLLSHHPSGSDPQGASRCWPRSIARASEARPCEFCVRPSKRGRATGSTRGKGRLARSDGEAAAGAQTQQRTVYGARPLLRHKPAAGDESSCSSAAGACATGWFDSRVLGSSLQ